MAATLTAAAEHLATEVAWLGHSSEARIAGLVADYDVDVDALIAFAVDRGLLKPAPRIGGYVVARKVNARVFGRAFAAFIAD